jgi:hypothetical protein
LKCFSWGKTRKCCEREQETKKKNRGYLKKRACSRREENREKRKKRKKRKEKREKGR